MVVFVNLTPHNIDIYSADGHRLFTIPKSGKVARVEANPEVVGDVGGIPLRKVSYGDITVDGEPIFDYVARSVSSTGQVVYIVSIVVLQALKTKGYKLTTKSFRFVAPDTNPDSVVRDKDGNIIGVKAFQTI